MADKEDKNGDGMIDKLVNLLGAWQSPSKGVKSAAISEEDVVSPVASDADKPKSSGESLAWCLTHLSENCANLRDIDFFPKNRLSELNDTDRKTLGNAISISNFDGRGTYTFNSFDPATRFQPMKYRWKCANSGVPSKTKGIREVFINNNFLPSLQVCLY